MRHHEGHDERHALVYSCLASGFLVVNVVTFKFLWTQLYARGKTSTTMQASNFTSTPSIVAHIVKVSESPGAYHSFGRGNSTRFYKRDKSTQSLASVKVCLRSCSAANNKSMQIIVRPWGSKVVGSKNV